MEYLYPHFQRELMMEDSRFHGGPRPGEPFPDFDLPTTDGGRIRGSDFVGRQPLLLSFSSVTCPMTADASSVLKPLYQEFGDRVTFVSLYVREAHPGENYPQPRSMQEKLQHARDYEQRDLIPWTVAIDDPDGTLHQSLDPKPNALYLIDRDGRVFARILWSNEEQAVRDALHALVEERPLRHAERTGKAVPMVRGIGHMHDVLSAAGEQALHDFRRALPPVYGLARLASAYRSVPASRRSLAAMASFLAVGLAALAGWRLIRRNRIS